MKQHISSTLFCEFVLILPQPFSTVATTSQLFAALLRPSQLFSITTTLFNSSQLFSTPLSDSHLCPPQLFSTRLNSSHLLPPLLNSSHLFSPPLNSSHLFLSSSQLFSPLVNSSPLLPTLLTSFHRDALHRETFAHRSFYIRKLLHREAFAHGSFYTQKLFAQRSFTHSFYTQQAVAKRSFHTENLLQYTGCAKMGKICCQSTICKLHAATTIRSTTFSCKRQ